MTHSVKDTIHGSEYGKAYKTGISAIKKEYRSRIKVKNPRNLEGSMDIDAACRMSEPTATRWDYLVAVKKDGKEVLALIEVHGAARFGEVEVLIKKKAWLVKWLSKNGLSQFKKRFIWVSTGDTKITAQSKYGKQLALAGISPPRRVTQLLDMEVEYR